MPTTAPTPTEAQSPRAPYSEFAEIATALGLTIAELTMECGYVSGSHYGWRSAGVPAPAAVCARLLLREARNATATTSKVLLLLSYEETPERAFLPALLTSLGVDFTRLEPK